MTEPAPTEQFAETAKTSEPQLDAAKITALGLADEPATTADLRLQVLIMEAATKLVELPRDLVVTIDPDTEQDAWNVRAYYRRGHPRGHELAMWGRGKTALHALADLHPSDLTKRAREPGGAAREWTTEEPDAAPATPPSSAPVLPRFLPDGPAS